MINIMLEQPRYHVTPYWNVTPIIRTGVDPNYSRGQLPVSWWVDHERVSWAIMHVAAKYACDVQEVVVFEVEEKPRAYFFIAPQIGVFRSGVLMRPTAMYPAYNWFPVEV